MELTNLQWVYVFYAVSVVVALFKTIPDMLTEGRDLTWGMLLILCIFTFTPVLNFVSALYAVWEQVPRLMDYIEEVLSKPVLPRKK